MAKRKERETEIEGEGTATERPVKKDVRERKGKKRKRFQFFRSVCRSNFVLSYAVFNCLQDKLYHTNSIFPHILILVLIHSSKVTFLFTLLNLFFLVMFLEKKKREGRRGETTKRTGKKFAKKIQ